MEGRHLIVSLFPMPPYVILHAKNGKLILRGYLGEVWTILEKQLKFTSEYVIENYIDAVVSAQNNSRDVILRPIVMTAQDLARFDYTMPLISSWYELYIKDSDEVNSSSSYIRNWSTELWIGTAAVILIFAILLYFMLHTSNKFFGSKVIDLPVHEEIHNTEYYSEVDQKFHLAKMWRKDKIQSLKKRFSNEGSLGNCFVTAIAAFCSQGCYIQSHMTSIRMLILSFLVFEMIMYNAYSALLVSQLTLGERFLPFNSLEEIPEKARSYSLCVREESYSFVHFTVNETTNILKSRWNNIVNKKPCTTGLLTPEVMCASHVAILESPTVMHESMRSNFQCKMTHLKGKYSNVDISILILQGFDESGKSQMNKKIMRLREIGILRHLMKKWMRHDRLPSPASDPVLQVTYDHIEGVLMSYASCIGVSILLFLLENCVKIYTKLRLKRRRLKHKSPFFGQHFVINI